MDNLATEQLAQPDQAVRGKVVQVFRFLEALNQLRNPVQTEITAQPWRCWLRELPEHSCIRRGFGPESDESLAGALLRIGRPRLSEPPEPPTDYRQWVDGDWRDPFAAVDLQSLLQAEARGVTEQVALEAQGRKLLEPWLARWRDWAATERSARRAMAIFEDFYRLHSRLEREGERFELLVGDGLLVWQPDSARQATRHPVLLQRIQLNFDPQVPEFLIENSDRPSELYTALFRAIPEVNAQALGRCREELDEHNWHPLGAAETDEYLKRLATQLAPRGDLVSRESLRAGADPQIARDPVLFLRSRNQGFALALESIIQDLDSSDRPVPAFLAAIVGEESTPSPAVAAGSPVTDNPNGEDVDVLLSKPANTEQLEIARRLEQTGAVLVQGPPGTGKTHTIANLLGHLLAQGMNVLVTSHTNKALRVLKEKVVEPLQPLCVSALADNNDDLEASINQITERLSALNPDLLEREAVQLVEERVGLLSRLRVTREQLRLARLDEYRPVLYGGQELEPAEAARWVAAHPEHAWIPAPVTLGEPLPLSSAELLELYRSNAAISPAAEADLQWPLPNLVALPLPETFAAWEGEYNRLEAADLAYREDLWDARRSPQAERVAELAAALAKATEPLQEQAEWQLGAVAAGQAGGAALSAWRELVRQIEQVCSLGAAAQEAIFRFGPAVPETCLPGQLAAVLQEMEQHLAGGGHLSGLKLMFSPQWKLVLEQAQVGGQPPTRPEHLQALRQLVELRQARRQLLERWSRQMAPLGAPAAAELGAEPELVCQQFVPGLNACLNWYSDAWLPLADQLRQQGLRVDSLIAEQPASLHKFGELLRLRQAVLEQLPAVIAAELDRLRWDSLHRTLSQLRDSLAANWSDSPVAASLLQSVDQVAGEQYAVAYRRLSELSDQQQQLLRRQQRLQQLRTAAPAWADQVEGRRGAHGEAAPPGDLQLAWQWRQLQDELERRAAVSLEELQKRISRLTTDLQQVTTSLVEKRAWAAQARRTTLAQQQALTGWLQLNKRAGKRTGKRAPKYLAEARKLMPICQTAVPVWIMPLSRVVESFSPGQNRFDVIIVDEASQADLLALSVLYMGRQLVVVGDDEQVSPLAIGTDAVAEDQLINEHLPGIPNSTLYGGQFSIYDLAQTTFQPVCLREHFRCVAPIIQFSNQLSYHGRIRPLRDDSDVRRKPATVVYRVDGSQQGHLNRQEAQAVVALVQAAIAQPEYAEASFGVIGMLGDEQPRLIDDLLRQRLTPAEYTKHRLLCGTPAEFQGDERDVIILSLVDANSADAGPLALRGFGPGNMYKKRYNVAVSRARDQLWVVHSLDISRDLKSDDLRLRLIRHAEQPRLGGGQASAPASGSELEQQVCQRLQAAGYQVVPNWQVGAFSIDLVVTGGGKRLAVECDGGKWQTGESLLSDMQRQAILERLGWTFVRIRGSQFFRNPDQAMAPLLARLRESGIPALVAGEGSAADDQPSLCDRVTRHAAAIYAAAHDSGAAEASVTVAKTAAAASRGEQPARQAELAPGDSHAAGLPSVGGWIRHRQFGCGEVLDCRESETGNHLVSVEFRDRVVTLHWEISLAGGLVQVG